MLEEDAFKSKKKKLLPDLEGNKERNDLICIFLRFVEAATVVVLLKKVFLEILQNSQEKNLCQSLFLNKVVG